MLLVIGDLNAKVGADNANYEIAMGKHGCGTMNNNDERLVHFCLNNDLVIGGTIFPHKNIRKLTWRSPNGRTLNQIDHTGGHLKTLERLEEPTQQVTTT